jgi:hypothetical protein
MVNLIRIKTLKKVFHYFFDMRVFLKTAGSKGNWATTDNSNDKHIELWTPATYRI